MSFRQDAPMAPLDIAQIRAFINSFPTNKATGGNIALLGNADAKPVAESLPQVVVPLAEQDLLFVSPQAQAQFEKSMAATAQALLDYGSQLLEAARGKVDFSSALPEPSQTPPSIPLQVQNALWSVEQFVTGVTALVQQAQSEGRLAVLLDNPLIGELIARIIASAPAGTFTLPPTPEHAAALAEKLIQPQTQQGILDLLGLPRNAKLRQQVLQEFNADFVLSKLASAPQIETLSALAAKSPAFQEQINASAMRATTALEIKNAFQLLVEQTSAKSSAIKAQDSTHKAIENLLAKPNAPQAAQLLLTDPRFMSRTIESIESQPLRDLVMESLADRQAAATGPIAAEQNLDLGEAIALAKTSPDLLLQVLNAGSDAEALQSAIMTNESLQAISQFISAPEASLPQLTAAMGEGDLLARRRL